MMDIIQRIKQYESEVYRTAMMPKTTVEYAHVSKILDRHDVSFVIEDDQITVNGNETASLSSVKMAQLLSKVVPSKQIEISVDVKNEERRQPFLLKLKQKYNPMIESDLPNVSSTNAYADVSIVIKEPFNNQPMNYKNPVAENEVTDLNTYVQHDLPATRDANPDYLYAVGHRNAHYYDRKRFLFDRAEQIILNPKVQAMKEHLKIVSYDEENRRRLKSKGYPVLSGYSKLLKSDDVVFIMPDICDAGWSGEYESETMTKEFRKLNRFLSEVDKFKTTCELVMHPYYPYWSSQTGEFDRVDFVPLVFHRPFVMLCPFAEMKKTSIYFRTTLKLSYYRTWLMYTGGCYDYTLINSDIVKDKDFLAMKGYFEKINELIIVGEGYIMKGGERLVLPKVDIVPTGVTTLTGKVQDYLKVLTPIVTSNIKIVSVINGEKAVKNIKGEYCVTRIKAEANLIRLARYNVKLNRLRNRCGLGNVGEFDVT